MNLADILKDSNYKLSQFKQMLLFYINKSQFKDFTSNFFIFYQIKDKILAEMEVYYVIELEKLL